MLEDKDLLSLELVALKNNNLFLELTQWLGMALVLILIVVAKLITGFDSYALFIVPLNYFAVARSDYLIHRNGQKIKAIENILGHVGNEYMQEYGGKSFIVLFDIPLFLGLAVLGKALSPYLLSDYSLISISYWVLCGLTGLMVWVATELAKRHYAGYERGLKGQVPYK